MQIKFDKSLSVGYYYIRNAKNQNQKIKQSESSKKKTLFDHINHIREKKTENYFDSLTDEDKKTFVNYMVNRFLSMDMNLVEVIDELQKHAVGLKPKRLLSCFA